LRHSVDPGSTQVRFRQITAFSGTGPGGSAMPQPDPGLSPGRRRAHRTRRL